MIELVQENLAAALVGMMLAGCFFSFMALNGLERITRARESAARRRAAEAAAIEQELANKAEKQRQEAEQVAIDNERICEEAQHRQAVEWRNTLESALFGEHRDST